MLEVAAEQGFKFDAVQLPLNVMDAHYRSFAAGCARTGQTEHRHSGHEKHGKRDSLRSNTVTPIECLHMP